MNVKKMTPRRCQIKELMLQGLACRQIAALTNCSTKTARTHVCHVLKLSGCATSRELMAREIQRLRSEAK